MKLTSRIVGMAGCLAVTMAVFSGGLDAAETWQDVAAGIETEADRATREANLTERLAQMSKDELMAELKDVKGRVQDEEAALNALKGEFGTLSKEEVELQKALEGEHQEVADVEGSVRGALKDAVSMVRDNPVTAQYPERGRTVDAMMDSNKFPGMAGIETLVNLYFHELFESGRIDRYFGDFIAGDGTAANGEILRAGRFTAYVQTADGEVRFLKPSADGQQLIAVAGDVPGSTKSAIADFYKGENDVLPVDPSGGAVFAQLAEKTDWRDTIEQGGILMYPILVVAAVAILLILERFVVLGATKSNTDKIMTRINEAALQRDWEQCQAICQESKRVPTCSMLRSAMNHIGATKEVLENALQEAILRQMPRLERFLPTLAVLAAIAPLLGLLGTVTGMINIFKVITVVGTGDPRVMSGGISEALLTTQFGLAVAIPIMLVHHFLERRVDRIVGDMEEKGTAFAVTLIKTGAITESEEALA